MRRSHHIIVIIFTAVYFPMAALCQLPSVSTSVNKKSILIGEQVELTVQVNMPDNHYRLTWLDAKPEFGSFVLASTDKIDSTYKNGLLGFSQKLHVTSFDSGRQVIPSLPFQFETLSGDSSFRMFTDSIAIDVMYSPADSVLPFHDIKSVLKVKKEKSRWFWPIIIAILLIVTAILFFILRKRKKPKYHQLFESDVSDFDEALASLKDLKTNGLPARGEFKLYYSKLTDIFKRYISRKTNDNKMHLTGAEIIEELSHHEVPRETLMSFASCIRMADAVKFAKYQPSISDSEASIDEVSKMITLLHSEKKEVENGV